MNSVGQPLTRLDGRRKVTGAALYTADVPLQEALHVQAYPTMILVDRHGRIRWRDQGATPTTLARLDRVVAAATRSDVVRR